jgi:hypothetical protein
VASEASTTPAGLPPAATATILVDMRRSLAEMPSGTKVAIVLIVLAVVFWVGVGVASLVSPDNPSSRNPPAGSNLRTGF